MSLKLIQRNGVRILKDDFFSTSAYCFKICNDRKHTTSADGSEKSSNLETQDEFPKAYEPVKFEEKWLHRWEGRKSQNGNTSSEFRMLFPPPNVTGKLHIGHALTMAIQDCIIRWKTMKGSDAQWIPGFDHAGIATHSVAMRKFKNDGATGSDFDKSIQNVAESNLMHIRNQLQSLGGLLNWSSEYYTLDESHCEVVKEAFLQLHGLGIIVREEKLVNWCCELKSSVADIEVDSVDFKGKMTLRLPKVGIVEFGVLHKIEYPLKNSDECIPVATSRPETMFGDVAVAVSPSDVRYSKFIGHEVVNPINGQSIPVIADTRVKTDFGTGAVKITPSHDWLDFLIGKVHNLPKINILTDDGFLNENCRELQGWSRFKSRQKVIDILDASGLYKGRQEYSGSLRLCSRTGDVIEPKVLPHWILKTRQLTDIFLNAIQTNEISIEPSHFKVDLLNRLTQSEDWCLSRQIRWGHEIPMWRDKNHPEDWVPAISAEKAQEKIATKYNIPLSDVNLIQDPDVLDTWFSSSLIPVSISGWPESKDIKKISLMETGSDILLFWVWRMAIVTFALTGQFPFYNVLLHGIVSDHYGRKMSKSKGNVIDPMHVINGISYNELLKDAQNSLEKGELTKNEYDLRVTSLKSEFPDGFKAFGRDALRFALLSQNASTDHLKLDIVYLDNCRHFTNKLWQALRFYTMNKTRLPLIPVDKPSVVSLDSVADVWILSCLHKFAKNAELYMDSNKFHLYCEAIRTFFYQQLCDVYIELIKHDFKKDLNIESHLLVMLYALKTGLKLAHPIIPFITEEIWSRLSPGSLLIEEAIPSSSELACFESATVDEAVMKTMKVVKEIRSLKSRLGIPAKESPSVVLDLSLKEVAAIKNTASLIESLASCSLMLSELPRSERNSFVTALFEFFGSTCRVSISKEHASHAFLNSDKVKIEKVRTLINKLKSQLEDPKFLHMATPGMKNKLHKRVRTLEIQLHNLTLNNKPKNEEKS